MFDIGWTELLVIGVVALIVVGPKDLPMMFRRLGQFTAKARGMAREFQRAMDQAADDAGVNEVSRDLRDMTSSRKLGIDSLKESTRDLSSLDSRKGPATRRLAEERAEKAARLRETTAARTTDRAAAPPAADDQAADHSTADDRAGDHRAGDGHAADGHVSQTARESAKSGG